ncbi:hypothetical protein BD769DRAFT_1639553 [Suillus cothurnatus]|nr:hypothetical protein BD769DRAFT_1639553 [Suillus cothurnatus]
MELSPLLYEDPDLSHLSDSELDEKPFKLETWLLLIFVNIAAYVIAIPIIPEGGNHTRASTDSARSQAAHDATLVVSKALAHVGMRVITDDGFLHQVKDAFKGQKNDST